MFRIEKEVFLLFNELEIKNNEDDDHHQKDLNDISKISMI
jgi:hypothetical protein